MDEQTRNRDGVLLGIDGLVLVVAVVAAALTAGQGDGRWGPFTTLVGLLLVSVVLGSHRPVSGGTVLRRLLLRVAFAGALSFCGMVALAWPMSWAWHAEGRPGQFDAATWDNVGIAALGVAALLACVEPDIAGLLERRRAP